MDIRILMNKCTFLGVIILPYEKKYNQLSVKIIGYKKMGNVCF